VQAAKGPVPTEWVGEREHPAAPTSAQRPNREPEETESPPYVASERGTFRLSADGERQLCNFTARIAEEVVRDDGQDRTRLMTLEGERAGAALPPVSMSFEQFSQMTWPMKH
jgi:hypothetical protein